MRRSLSESWGFSFFYIGLSSAVIIALSYINPSFAQQLLRIAA